MNVSSSISTVKKVLYYNMKFCLLKNSKTLMENSCRYISRIGNYVVQSKLQKKYLLLQCCVQCFF